MTNQPVPGPVVSCPDCGTPITTGSDRCRSCGLLLVGRTAARLWQVDQQLTSLRAERTSLLADLRARSELAPVAVGAAAEPPATAGLPKYPGRAHLSGPSGRGLDVGAQRLILGTGAALVVVAAVVFTAVAWTVIPLVGQAALMVAATSAAAIASVKVAARGLRGSAETLAAVTAGLVLIDITAARTLGLAGLERVDGGWYATGGAILAAALFVALVRCTGTAGGPHLYAWAAVAAAATVPSLGAAAAHTPPVTFAVVALATAAAFAAVSERMADRWAPARPCALIVAVVYATAATALSVVGSFVEPLLGEPGARDGSAVAFAAVALAAAALLRVGTTGVPSAAVRAIPVLVAVAAGLGLCSHSRYGVLVLSVLGAAAAGAAAIGSAGPRQGARPLLGRTLVAGHGIAAAALVAFAVETADGHVDGSQVGRLDVHLLALGLTAIAGAAALTAAMAPVTTRARAGLTAYAGAALLLAAGLATSPAHDSLLSTAGVLVATIAITATAAWRHGTPDEPLLAVVAGGGFLAAAAIASDDPRTLALVAGSAGVSCLGYALLPARGRAAVGGVIGCSVAIWLLLADADVHLVEAYTLPLAGIAGVVGGVRLAREPRASSWATVGPALVAGLLPSAVASVGDDALARPLAVLLAGTVTVAAGLRLRWQAPVVMGTVAMLVVAVAQLAPYAVGVPRWISLGGVGVALLVLGVRYERTRQAAVGAARWAHRLH